MPQHLSSFQLSNYTTARDDIIPDLRPYFETEAFQAFPANATYVECIPDAAARARLEPLLSLIFEGPARVIISRISGHKRLHASSLPCLHVPVLIYEPTTADDRRLEIGCGIYTDRGIILNGKLVLVTVIPTHIKVRFNSSVTPSLANPDFNFA
ncbi:hypothetical protein BDV33DRAFT_57501 [Aspergillus novoparasiticus]|uniref:Uncharacterized protein n=1 Tax=Aspergillus novoparasiticus TaxID=986946 RepID=A0A5N6E862_9EURO|nr:hypothetical protein BDV33DRAFT_57501 [Aspergillus novoparasiticus]